jgi:enoyl-CoA hydratase
MSEAEPLILEARDGDVVTLTFNDPSHRNAMTAAMGESFCEVVAGLAHDESLRAVVLTGGGSAFSAGGDMGMIEARAAEGQARPGLARRAIRDTMRSFYKLFLSIRDVPCPTIAAINGHAIGAGFCVALGCDMRFAAADAKLALNFTKLGLHPGMGATWTVPRLVGPALAAEVLYTSRIFSGAQAAEIGLVNRALPGDEVLPTARAVAAEIAGCAPLAVRGLKRALERSLDASLEDQLSFEAGEQSICFESADVLEGIEAGKARRTPRFEGR